MFKAKVHYDAEAYSRPKKPSNDLDVYFKPMMDELL
jgi:hypothetical protein